jgi:P27 family predicted phage terminase small subunit
MRGRKPKPAHLKLVAGNPGRRPIPENQPRPPVAAPGCPSHLDEVAQVEWQRIVPLLLGMGVLSEVDRAVLAGYCAAYSRWAKAEERLAEHGPIVKAPRTGTPMHSPFLAVANAAMAQMAKLAAEFGMTPSSRSRIESNGQPTPTTPVSRYFD